MSDWYRKKVLDAAYRGAAAAAFVPLAEHFWEQESWVRSLEAGGGVVSIAALRVAFWVWRGRQVRRRYGY